MIKLMYEITKKNCVYVNSKVFNTITDVSNPQGILAVVKELMHLKKKKL